MGTSFQSRLSAIENRLSRKLIDNSLNLMGSLTDVILIQEDLTSVQDVSNLTIDSIGVVNISFPPMLDIPTWRFVNQQNNIPISANDEKKDEPIICYSPVLQNIDQGSLLLRFIENSEGDMPWILVLKVADVHINFGMRTSINKMLICSYYDQPINPQLLDWLEKFAVRRGLLGY
jgi:hypothetical protein